MGVLDDFYTNQNTVNPLTFLLMCPGRSEHSEVRTLANLHERHKEREKNRRELKRKQEKFGMPLDFTVQNFRLGGMEMRSL